MADIRVILLVEDLEDDILLVTRAFKKVGLTNPMQVVRDGEEAIDYLRGEGKYANRDEYPLPSLILLDLKLPKIDGFEVLTWVRAHPTLKTIPVLVLTSSDHIRDVNRAYELGANSFLVKQLDFDELSDAAAVIKDYWLRLAETPKSTRTSREGERDGIGAETRAKG